MKNQVLSDVLGRWKRDLKELVGGLLSDPLAVKGRSWERDFIGEVSKTDKRYAIFLGLATLIPAILVLNVSSEPEWKRMAQFFGAPLQVVIMGFLTSILLFAGSHLNRVPKPYNVAFKLMLRLMAAFPLLSFLNLYRYGQVIVLLIFGLLVVRGARRTYGIPAMNALFFFGVIYFIFALMQLQTLRNLSIATPAKERVTDLGNSP